jgi:hypothetical protein
MLIAQASTGRSNQVVKGTQRSCGGRPRDRGGLGALQDFLIHERVLLTDSISYILKKTREDASVLHFCSGCLVFSYIVSFGRLDFGSRVLDVTRFLLVLF